MDLAHHTATTRPAESSLPALDEDAMHRRALLSGSAALLALPVGAHLLDASSLIPTALEVSGTAAAALETTEHAVHMLAQDHMLPTSAAADIHTGAVAAWRDAVRIRELRGELMPKAYARALQVQALAAALVAELLGDAGDVAALHMWGAHAFDVAQRADAAGDARGQATAGLVLALTAKKRIFDAPARAEAMAMTAWTIGLQAGRNCAVRALAPAVVARARAAQGHVTGARDALRVAVDWAATGSFPRPPAPTVLGFTPRTARYTAADVYALTGDADRARDAADAWAGSCGCRAGVMDTAMLALAEAFNLAYDGELAAAAQHAADTLAALPAAHHSAVVRGRAAQLIERLRGRRAPGELGRLRDVLQQMTTHDHTGDPAGDPADDGEVNRAAACA
jgi:hypothetical protein